MAKKGSFFGRTGAPRASKGSAGKRKTGNKPPEQQTERPYVGAGLREGDTVNPGKLKDVGWDVVN